VKLKTADSSAVAWTRHPAARRKTCRKSGNTDALSGAPLLH